MSEEERLYAKGMLLRARVYRLCAFLFALSGVGLFVLMFLNSSGGRISMIMTDPVLVVIVVFPFIPAIILNFLAKKADEDFAVALEKWKVAAGKIPAQK